ncbi:MAG: trypsin-like peptidase domain-containing protein [Acidobacteria bacterium]|nr:trypsin-like peptidase domain-containing protein [Acidobacteriota bacterium]
MIFQFLRYRFCCAHVNSRPFSVLPFFSFISRFYSFFKSQSACSVSFERERPGHPWRKRLTQTILFAAFVIFFCPSFVNSQTVSVETIEQVKKTVAFLACVTPAAGDVSAKITVIAGSSFFINSSGQFMTANHVISGLNVTAGQEKCVPAVFLSLGDWNRRTEKVDVKFFQYQKCRAIPLIDFTVCQAVPNPFVDAELKPQISFMHFEPFSNFKDGTPVAFTGFPLQIHRPVTSQAIIASYLPDGHKIVFDTIPWKGSSGAPLYTANGKVIGIVIEQGTNAATGIGMAISSDLLIKALTENKVEFNQDQ